MRAYKAAFEQAALPLEVWVCRLVWLCADGANVMVGTNTGLVGLLRELQREVTGHAYFVAMHANYHRANLAFKNALKEVHALLDVLNATVGYILQLLKVKSERSPHKR